MQYRQDIVTRMPITQVELITISIVIIQSIWHNSAADFFCLLENFRHKFANIVATPTDRTTKRLVRCKAHPVL